MANLGAVIGPYSKRCLHDCIAWTVSSQVGTVYKDTSTVVELSRQSRTTSIGNVSKTRLHNLNAGKEILMSAVWDMEVVESRRVWNKNTRVEQGRKINLSGSMYFSDDGVQ